jgi:hypothetical protein
LLRLIEKILQTVRNTNQQKLKNMKALITSIVAMFILATASASNFEGIKVASAGKPALEATFSTEKASTATISITNQAGVVVKTTTVAATKGTNTFSLIDVATLEEGTFTITPGQQQFSD